MRVKTNVVGVTLLAFATDSFASFIAKSSPVTISTAQQFLAEDRAASSTPFPSPIPIKSEFSEDWSPSSNDRSAAEVGYTTLAVMFTVYPDQSTTSKSISTTSSSATTATAAHTSVNNSGGVKPDARVSRRLILFATLGGIFVF